MYVNSLKTILGAIYHIYKVLGRDCLGDLMTPMWNFIIVGVRRVLVVNVIVTAGLVRPATKH